MSGPLDCGRGALYSLFVRCTVALKPQLYMVVVESLRRDMCTLADLVTEAMSPKWGEFPDPTSTHPKPGTPALGLGPLIEKNR